MKSIAKVAVLSALILVPGVASAFRAWNRAQVYDLGSGVFEVVNYFGTVPRDYWCGAGDYAIRVLRTPATQRVYLWQAEGPSVSEPGRKGVKFSLKPPAGADTTPGFTVTVKRVGDNMSASMAQNYCYDNTADEIWLK
ncbi:hypothetical protein FGK63_19810 [Ruegeria sediminis]|uniref:Uncharacterized protein n=1 Tax=Ruegeria sediminis TaxID=2583820 RepID=A0ABY2WS65_9RHOB|nr:hypothetical protein [Ruegeria sediminis]TMV03258.1 hypothetical protein FGK63_19810 [Ruegeria sediminis]